MPLMDIQTGQNHEKQHIALNLYSKRTAARIYHLLTPFREQMDWCYGLGLGLAALVKVAKHVSNGWISAYFL